MRRVRVLLWAALLVAGVGAFAAQRMLGSERTEKGELGRVPDFALTDQLGKPVSNRDLLGKPWVANFVFTRCPSVCPLLTAKFKALQSKVALPDQDVEYVSFSVDPQHDTPEVLAAYAAKYQANPGQWRFLTGPLAEVEKTIVQGFKIHMGDATPHAGDPSLIDIMHGEHFVLIDATGMIRGYYRSEAAELAELATDLRALVNSGEAHAQLVQ
ncbi:MAG: photosynthetic protein synthase [Myxococcaceae bacterium]|nr:photosynthetic protein synthase [Myxococcaceae bacterium]